MKYKIRYLRAAKQDMLDLIEYLDDQYDAIDTAENLINEIHNHIAHLAEFPYAHPLYHAPMRLPIEMRYLPVKNHIVFYTILEPDRIVEIRRVVFMRINLSNLH